ncbi:NPB protein, partial [Urocolius indicus]|nr:NPB protein [Urocolius indicus]
SGPAGTMRAARWLGLLPLLCLCRPAEPWYRPAAGPRHYSVGRASGLLSGLRHSPHARRSDAAAEAGTGALPPGSARLRAAVSTGGAAGAPGHLPRSPLMVSPQAPCVTDVAPEPRSCRALPGAAGALRCKAAVTVSWDPLQCAAA